MTEPAKPQPVASKVQAATAGSGIGAAGAIVVSYLLAELFPDWPDSVNQAVTLILLTVGPALGAFVGGYMKTETRYFRRPPDHPETGASPGPTQT